jgi:hypothetical protein
MAIVLPVFILLLAGVIFFHRTLRKKQDVMLAARAKAWESAMNACEKESVQMEEVPHPDRTSDMEGAPGAEVSTAARYGYATATSEGVARLQVVSAGALPAAEANGILFETDLSAKATVMCNTKAERGNMPGALHWVMRGREVWDSIFNAAKK